MLKSCVWHTRSQGSTAVCGLLDLCIRPICTGLSVLFKGLRPCHPPLGGFGFWEFPSNTCFYLIKQSLVGLSMCAPPVASFSVKDSSGFDLIKVSKTYKIVSITLSQEGPYIFFGVLNRIGRAWAHIGPWPTLGPGPCRARAHVVPRRI